MKPVKTIWLFALCTLLWALTAGCSAPSAGPSPQAGSSGAVSSPAHAGSSSASSTSASPSSASSFEERVSSSASSASTSSAAPPAEASAPSSAAAGAPSAVSSSTGRPSPEDGQEAILYIGTVASGFREYGMPYPGDLTPEMLIEGISNLTQWDLSLADAVATGKGGMTVCFSGKSALFVGPPDPQVEEFFVFGIEDLAQTILDSIQKTLQMNFTEEGGDPDALDIYFCMEGDLPLALASLGLSWPLDQPYQWSSAVTGGAFGQDSEIVEYLRQSLSEELGDLSQAAFLPNGDVTINGEVCRVFEITRKYGGQTELLGIYAVSSGLNGIYQFNVQTAAYEEYARR